MKLIKLCNIKDLEEGKIKSIDIENLHLIAILKDNKVYVFDGYCTHEDADLANGFLLEDVIICPLHLSQFNIYTGEVMNPPAEKPLKKYNSLVKDSEVYFEIDK